MTKQEPTTEVQSLILNKSKFETEQEARDWAKDHDFKTDKLDETDDSWRFRQFDPDRCMSGTFRTIELDDDVSAVICRPKVQTGVGSFRRKMRARKSWRNKSLIRKLNTVLEKHSPSRAGNSEEGRPLPKNAIVIDAEELAEVRRQFLVGQKSLEIINSKIKKWLSQK